VVVCNVTQVCTSFPKNVNLNLLDISIHRAHVVHTADTRSF